jgi:hypothetical protein
MNVRRRSGVKHRPRCPNSCSPRLSRTMDLRVIHDATVRHAVGSSSCGVLGFVIADQGLAVRACRVDSSNRCCTACTRLARPKLGAASVISGPCWFDWRTCIARRVPSWYCVVSPWTSTVAARPRGSSGLMSDRRTRSGSSTFRDLADAWSLRSLLRCCKYTPESDGEMLPCVFRFIGAHVWHLRAFVAGILLQHVCGNSKPVSAV